MADAGSVNTSADNSAAWQGIGQNQNLQAIATEILANPAATNFVQTDSQAPAPPGGPTNNSNSSNPTLAAPDPSTTTDGISTAALLQTGEFVSLVVAMAQFILSEMQEENADRQSTFTGTMDEIQAGQDQAQAQYNSGMDQANKDIIGGAFSIAGGVLGGVAGTQGEAYGKAVGGIASGAGSIAGGIYEMDKATQDSTATLMGMGKDLMGKWVDSSRQDKGNMEKLIGDALQMLAEISRGIHHLGQGS